MNDLVSGNVGAIHLVASILALIFGTWIFLGRKGTKLHAQTGYGYVISMGVLLISAFMLYEFNGRFGVFHVAAVVSSMALILGMIPVFRRPTYWIIQHFSWMYWSVIGLYGALISEICTRLFPELFYEVVGIAMFGVMLLGAMIFSYAIPVWKDQFYSKSKKK